MYRIIIALIIGYIFGLFQTGKILGLIKGFNLNSEGSGNAGATNALRTHGKKIGLLTFLGDVIKAIIPMTIFGYILSKDVNGYRTLISLYIGIGTILGHCFPLFLKMKGGKGVSTALGVVLASNPIMAIIPLTSFLLISIKTRYVSLGSIVAVVIVAIEGFIFSKNNLLSGSSDYYSECVILYIVLALIIIFKHRENIIRLIKGKENKI